MTRNRTATRVPPCCCGRHISARGSDGLRMKHRPDANSVVGPMCPGSDQPIDQEKR